MAGKTPLSLLAYPIRHSLLALAALTLICFTVLILRSPPQYTIPGPAPITPLSSIYHSPEVFRLNYAEMERDFKVFIYPDGDPKTYYQTPRKMTGKYASEGFFFQNIRESRFRTEDPELADLFFIPISCHKMRGKGISYENMTIIVQNYVEGLINKYPYWNRTLGTDHFVVTCHDVGVRAFEGLPFLVKNSIRVVCSPSYNVAFIPHKDVALPQVLQPFALPAGGNDIENRTVLGFWAGHRNSKIRVILARVWENDTELAISNNRINRAIGELVYQKRFYRTKFCICPGGSQVNSARITDSIHYGCIPVILSDYYDLPFNDILDWKKFSVILREKDVYQLKPILKSISNDDFVALHKGVVECLVGPQLILLTSDRSNFETYTWFKRKKEKEKEKEKEKKIEKEKQKKKKQDRKLISNGLLINPPDLGHILVDIANDHTGTRVFTRRLHYKSTTLPMSLQVCESLYSGAALQK